MNTRKLMALAAISVAAAMPSWAADMTISTDYVLNDDLTVDGTLTVASGATVDINGHKLSVKGLAGAGSITDSKSYELLDYVEANGAQRIVTDYVPGANTKIDVVATPTDNSSLTLFGTKSWANYRFLCMCQNNNWYFFGKNVVVGTFTANTRYRFVVSGGTATLFNDETGTQIGTKGVHMNNNDNAELAICGITGNANRGRFKIYSFKVWHENVMQFDFVPVRNPATSEIGLLDRIDGTLHVSDESPFIAGAAVGSLSIGALRVEAASEAALSGFAGTVGSNVRMFLDGNCKLTADADWRRFGLLQIDGTVELAGHDLSLTDLRGTGTVSDYEVLAYVEATNAQRICTGIVPGPDTAVELDMTHLVNDNGNVLFGCDSWSTYRYMLVYANSKPYFFGEINKCCNVLTTDTRYLITLSPTTSPNGTVKFVVKHTEAAHGSFTASFTYGGNSELCLFGLGDGTRMSKYRLHSFKITKSGDLKRDFVPVRHAKTGAVGLFDKVSGRLFTSDTGVELVAGPVSTEAEKLGSLHVDVAEGSTVVADTLALSGSLALVKKGAGTLFMNRPGQTYMGGTCVAGGVLTTKSGGAQNVSIAGDAYFGKPGSRIMADAGGVFDFNGNSDYRIYNIVLNGGTLRNGGYDQAQNQGSLGHLTITTNSVIETKFNITVFNATTDLWNLGGYTLSVDTLGKTLYFRDSVVLTNGVFWLKGDGCWHVNAAVQARGVNLRAESALWLGAKVDVDDYYAACTFDSNNGTAAMNVYGRFTPATDYFYGCTLQDGATLDLNGRNGAWSTTSAFTSGANNVTFASGATITVDAHARPTWIGKIVDWGEGGMPTDVTFKLDDASRAMGRNLHVRDKGLYATVGVMIFIR